MAEPVQDLAPSVEHFGSGLAHAIGVRELASAAPDRAQGSLVEGDVLRLGQGLQQCAVFVVKPQIHGHDDMVPKWYYVEPRPCATPGMPGRMFVGESGCPAPGWEAVRLRGERWARLLAPA